MKISLEITPAQHRAISDAASQVRATPEQLIVAAACSALQMEHEEMVAEYTRCLIDFVDQKHVPNIPQFWKFGPYGIDEKEVAK